MSVDVCSEATRIMIRCSFQIKLKCKISYVRSRGFLSQTTTDTTLAAAMLEGFSAQRVYVRLSYVTANESQKWGSGWASLKNEMKSISLLLPLLFTVSTQWRQHLLALGDFSISGHFVLLSHEDMGIIGGSGKMPENVETVLRQKRKKN